MQLKDPDLLQALIKSKGLSGRRVAEGAGWRSHTYLQRLLRGEVTTLKPESAIALADFLGVATEVLFVPKVDRNTAQTVQQSGKKIPA